MSHKRKEKEFTHKGKITKPTFGWEWSEELRETPRYWVSRVPNTKYRKTDGKQVGGGDILNLDSIYEMK